MKPKPTTDEVREAIRANVAAALALLEQHKELFEDEFAAKLLTQLVGAHVWAEDLPAAEPVYFELAGRPYYEGPEGSCMSFG